MNHRITIISVFSIIKLFFTVEIAYSQIIIDKTNIENASIVNNHENNINITGGTNRGSSIFHSFKAFSLKQSQKANFDTNSNINNIIVRVNGNTRSDLNGTILTKHPSKLIFINPSGISIGKFFKSPTLTNLTLTSASSIKFSDGFILRKNNFISGSRTDNFAQKLDFNTNSKDIFIENSGKLVTFFAPLIPKRIEDFEDSLTIKDNGSINIFGNNILIDGGVLNLENSYINLASIQEGSILLGEKDSIEKIDGILSDISINNHSLIYSEGIHGGINLHGSRVKIDSGSILFHYNDGLSHSGISISSKNLDIIGALKSSNFIEKTNSITKFSENKISGIYLFNSSDDVSDISINSEKFNLLSGGLLVNHGGPISINTDDLIIDSVENDFNSLDSSVVLRPSLNFDGDLLTVKSNNISILNGGILGSSTISEKNAGKVRIDANNITLDSFNKITKFPSSIASASFGLGNSNDVAVTANFLNIRNGAVIASASAGGGNTGETKITANQILISGLQSGPSTGISSTVLPASNNLDDPNNILIPKDEVKVLLGKSGNVIVKSEELDVINGSISVSNFANRDAGNIILNSDRINLENSRIRASTLNGNGGNIDINSNLVVFKDSRVTSSARNFGIGGNIQLSSKLFVLNQSTLEANAENNQAGNIEINAISIFSDTDSTITANSNLGANSSGEIIINQRQNELKLTQSLPTINNSISTIGSQCKASSSFATKYGTGIESAQLSEKQLRAISLKQRLNIARRYHYIDAKTGEKKPFEPWLGIQRKNDGNLELVFSPEQSKSLQNLLSSLEDKCSAKY